VGAIKKSDSTSLELGGNNGTNKCIDKCIVY